MTLFNDDIFNLADIAHEVSSRAPKRVAVIEPTGRDARTGVRTYARYTYRQLSRDAESIALGLRDIGIAERTRTVFMAPPSYRACVIGLALTRVGATTIWIDPSVGYRNVGERLRRLSPEAFVGVPLAHLGRLFFGWGPRFKQKRILVGDVRLPGYHTIESLRRDPPLLPARPAVTPDDTCAILYTTGSTGPAKPVLYTHRNFAHIHRVVHESWRFASRSTPPLDLAAFPAFGFIALSAGGTVVVPPIDFAREGPADADPEAVLEVINDCGVTSMFGSPALLGNMARHAAAHGTKTPSLRRVIGGGAPIFPSTMKPLLDMVGDEGEILSDYGATEALPATEMSAREVLADTWAQTERGAGLCVGRPFSGVELRIFDITDERISSLADAELLGPGEVGEIVVRSRHVSPAYFGDDDNTTFHKIDDGHGSVWHRLRDAGYLDEQGRLWYCGRVSHRVITDQGTLFPLQVEPIINRHPDVCRSALVGVTVNGHTNAVICVEPDPRVPASERDALRSDLLALAATHAATRSVRTVLFHRRLPVDPRHNSKIDRPALATWAAKRLTRFRQAA